MIPHQSRSNKTPGRGNRKDKRENQGKSEDHERADHLTGGVGLEPAADLKSGQVRRDPEGAVVQMPRAHAAAQAGNSQEEGVDAHPTGKTSHDLHAGNTRDRTGALGHLEDKCNDKRTPQCHWP